MRYRWIVAVLCFFPSLVLAQPMADHVPADALFYAGWAGSQNLGATYDQSHLKAVLADCDAQKLFTEFLPKLSEKIGQTNPQGAQIYSFLASVGARFWRHPSAIYWGGVDFTNPRRPQPRIQLICDAGDEAASLAKELQTAIDASGKTPTPIAVSAQGSIVTLLIGPQRPVAGARPNLAADGRFKEAFASLQANPVAAAYIDLEGIVALLNQTPVRGKTEATARENWNKLRDALALDKLHTFAWAGAFDGKDWSTRAFLAAPTPRTGILAILDAAAVSEDILKLVPKNATMIGACTFDPAKLLAGMKATAAKVDPNSPQKFQQGLDTFRTMTGLDLQKDLLEQVGDQWAYYSDPDVAGSFGFCATLINKLRDGKKADASFSQFERTVSNFLDAAAAAKNLHVTFRQTTTTSGLTIHYLATPILRPSWTIKNDVLYVGLFPQVVAAAADHPSGPSILDNPSFTAVRKRIGEHQATSIRYVDLPRTAPLVYPTWMFLSSYVGFGDLFGVPAPAMLIPPLTDLLPELAPAGQVSWVDDTGWHMQGITPFPGATIIGSDPTTTIAAPALAASILLPAMNRAKETSKRVECANNERSIGQAILIYANEHKGKYPPDLGTLYKTQQLDIDDFLCPASDESIPQDIRTAPKDAQAAWINANSTYIYVGQNMNFNAPADNIVLYEKSDDHDQQGMNLLYADGHVDWNTMELAQKLIKSTPPGSKAPTTR